MGRIGEMFYCELAVLKLVRQEVSVGLGGSVKAICGSRRNRETFCGSNWDWSNVFVGKSTIGQPFCGCGQDCSEFHQ